MKKLKINDFVCKICGSFFDEVCENCRNKYKEPDRLTQNQHFVTLAIYLLVFAVIITFITILATKK